MADDGNVAPDGTANPSGAPPNRPTFLPFLKDYGSLLISLLALLVSSFTLYVSHYGGPQDFRAVIYLPHATQKALDIDWNDLSVLVDPDAESKAREVPDEQAKSFRLDISQNVAFINAGSSSILVSSVGLIVPQSGTCSELQDFATTHWKNSPFVVLPGQIISSEIIFNSIVNDRKSIIKSSCIRFIIADRSGREFITTYPDISVNSNDFVRFIDQSPLSIETKQSRILLRSLL